MPAEVFQIDLYPVTAELWNIKMELARLMGEQAQQIQLINDNMSQQTAILTAATPLLLVGLGAIFGALVVLAFLRGFGRV